MNLSNPARDVIPSLQADVLAVLSGTTLPLTGRQVHQLARAGSWSGVRNVLVHLESSGLVDVVEAGPAHLYTLNRDHVAASAALALSDLRGALFERIRATLVSWRVPPVAASVFGSAARGEGGSESDVDLFVVRPAGTREDDIVWAEQVATLAVSIRRWSGNPASIIQVSPAQVRDMQKRDAPMVAELNCDQVPLVGPGVLGRRELQKGVSE